MWPNLVPPFETSGNYHGTSAALEFGVRHLQVENIVVLGHAQWGGIRALHGWYFDMERGELLRYNSGSNRFEALS